MHIKWLLTVVAWNCLSWCISDFLLFYNMKHIYVAIRTYDACV